MATYDEEPNYKEDSNTTRKVKFTHFKANGLNDTTSQIINDSNKDTGENVSENNPDHKNNNIINSTKSNIIESQELGEDSNVVNAEEQPEPKVDLQLNSPSPADTSLHQNENTPEDYTDDARGAWGNHCEFILTCLGYAVGFGNVWRFPYLCYKNGGAVFLIPYVTMLLCAGLPVFFMELVLGQYTSLNPSVIFPNLSPIFSGLGWAMLMTSFLLSIYYNMILAWTLFYIFNSFTWTLPWSTCTNNFNSPNCFTYKESVQCEEKNLFYYGKECIHVGWLCKLQDLQNYNTTHCVRANGAMIHARDTIHRISASEDFFRNRMLGVEGKSWEDFGSIRWELVGCLALAWTLVCACVIKGVKSTGKVVYFTALFPYVVLIILLIRGLTLDGAYNGIEFYLLKPNMTKLYDIEVWNDAATQIFYSLGSAFGVLITLASYNKFYNNCMRDALVISILNCSTSVFAGCVIFSILGFMAYELGVDVGDVVESGSGLAFIAYPAAVTMMPFPPVWAVLFFFMLITLGLGSQFSYIETLAAGIMDVYPSLRQYKPLVMISICTSLFICGLTQCYEGGVFMFELLNWYSAGMSIVIIALVELIVVHYIFGFKNFLKIITEEMKIWIPAPLRCYWCITWVFVTPVLLLLILVLSIINIIPSRWGSYVFPHNIQVMGWLICGASVVMVPLFAVWTVCCRHQELTNLFQAKDDFCPAHRRNNADDLISMSEGTFKQVHENKMFFLSTDNILST